MVAKNSSYMLQAGNIMLVLRDYLSWLFYYYYWSFRPVTTNAANVFETSDNTIM